MLQRRSYSLSPGDDAYELKAEALRIWNEYQMHTQGGITYPMMGYISADGTIPAIKVHEHQLAHNYYERAAHDQKKRQRGR